MKWALICVIVILFFQRCTSSVEIPAMHAGVVKNGDQVDTLILKPGEHAVSFGSEVIVYDLSEVALESEFDFLFSDASAGNLSMAIEFEPIPDSLAAFYRKYESIHITPIVDQGVRKIARDLLFRYKQTDLTMSEFEAKIIGAIKSNDTIVNYVLVKEIHIIELQY